MNIRSSFLAVALLLAIVPAAHAQRASLAERIAALEQRAATDQGNVDLLRQVNALKDEVQSLRGQLEELQHELQTWRESSRRAARRGAPRGRCGRRRASGGPAPQVDSTRPVGQATPVPPTPQ